jgi:hypothetical protein
MPTPIENPTLKTRVIKRSTGVFDRKTWRRVCFIAPTLLFLVQSVPAFAHIGPPYPIMENRKIGTMTVTVWSNPDVGTGSFYIIIDPPPGVSVPSDMQVRVAVQPVSKRLPEESYAAWREKLFNRVEFKADAPFDKEETWRIRVSLASSQVSGETDTEVEVTPALLGRWDLLFFLLPFLGVGFLWFKAVSTKLQRRKRAQRKKAQQSSAG